MALFINHYTEPFHIYIEPLNTGLVESHPDFPNTASYTVSGSRTSPSAICGISVQEANSQGGGGHKDFPRDLLHVTEMAAFSDLQELVNDPDLCPSCKMGLADRWPPAAEYVEESEDSEDGGDGEDSEDGEAVFGGLFG